MQHFWAIFAPLYSICPVVHSNSNAYRVCMPSLISFIALTTWQSGIANNHILPVRLFEMRRSWAHSHWHCSEKLVITKRMNERLSEWDRAGFECAELLPAGNKVTLKYELLYQIILCYVLALLCIIRVCAFV